MGRLNTAKEIRAISDNVRIKKLIRGKMEMVNLFQEAINLKAYNGEYRLHIDKNHPLFIYIMKYDIRSIFNALGYEVEAQEERVSAEESEVVGYTIKW